MSKTNRPDVKKLVETVENLMHLLSWISSSMTFWKIDIIFPGNLIKKCCDDYYDDLYCLLNEDKAND